MEMVHVFHSNHLVLTAIQLIELAATVLNVWMDSKITEMENVSPRKILAHLVTNLMVPETTANPVLMVTRKMVPENVSQLPHFVLLDTLLTEHLTIVSIVRNTTKKINLENVC